MPRLFTGLELPEHVADALALQRGGLPGARWIDSDLYHITLRFLGDVDDHVAGEFADRLARVQRDPFPVQIEGLRAFGSRKPHSLVASVATSPALVALQAEQERIAQRVGLAPETRKFSPHVTLARLRGAGEREVANYLTLRGGFSAGPFMARRFVLFSSRSTTGGGPYLVEETYPLGREPEHETLGEWSEAAWPVD